MKTLFENYPTIQYKSNGTTFFLKDFTRRSVFFDNIRNDFNVVAEYRVEEGETPTSLAQDFYGKPELFWILLYINNIVDPFFDWPMSYADLQTWIDKSIQNPDEIEFYTFDGLKYETDAQVQSLMNQLGVVDTDELLEVSGVLGITKRMNQEIINDEKRNIIVIRPELISRVLHAFEESFK